MSLWVLTAPIVWLCAASPDQCFIATDRACTSTGTTTR
jgi:hypothetical protein